MPTPGACDVSEYDAVWESHFAQRNLLKRVKASYPAEAVDQGIAGEVQVTIVVDRQGSVVKACAKTGPDILRRAAEEAARQWTFKRDFGHEPGGGRRYTVDGIAFDFVLPARTVSSRP
jgi:TonB family protein